MKESKFNFVFPYEADDSKTLLYNSITNALALIENDKLDQFNTFRQQGTPISDDSLLHDLTYGGYVVDDDTDELAMLRYHMLQSRFNSSRMNLTIAPTSDCNFRCIYCYEKESLRNSFMSKEVQQGILDYITNIAPSLTSLSVTWYGGEPLLALNVIEYLAEKIMSICDENHVTYTSSIITNGYLLTPAVASTLGRICVSHIQITLDGSREQHDKRRPLMGGQPTFDKIISNIEHAKENLPCPISIRINVDKENISEIDEVLNILTERGLDDCTTAYLGMVENSNSTYQEKSCFCVEEFSMADYEFRLHHGTEQQVLSYPDLVYSVCSAECLSGLVVDSDGLLYKCWDDIGIADRSIGKITEDGATHNQILLDYMLYDPTKDDECKECKYLPICMGGCPHRRQYLPEIRCTMQRYQMDKNITRVANHMVAQKSTSCPASCSINGESCDDVQS